MNVNRISDVSTTLASTTADKPGRRAHQMINNPRLASDFGGEPAELVGDLRAEHGEHQNPQQPAPFVQRAVAEIKKSQGRDGNHGEADAHHAVEKQERRRDRRTVFRGEIIQADDQSLLVSWYAKKLNIPGIGCPRLFRFCSSTQPTSVSGALEVVL